MGWPFVRDKSRLADTRILIGRRSGLRASDEKFGLMARA
jgi:hypothetical protein